MIWAWFLMPCFDMAVFGYGSGYLGNTLKLFNSY